MKKIGWISCTVALILFGLACQNTGQQNAEKEGSGKNKEQKVKTKEMKKLKVMSEAFQDGKPVPKLYTCEGKDISPELKWHNVPEGTKSFVLIVDDPDAPEMTWVHWVLYNLPADVKQLRPNILPDNIKHKGALHGKNSFDQLKYGGPCPPKGHGVHHYHFKVYALDKMLDLEEGAGKDHVLHEMEGHILAKGKVTGTYERKKEEQ